MNTEQRRRQETLNIIDTMKIERIAKAGAAKMAGKYTFQPEGEDFYRITKVETGENYLVNPTDDEILGICTCPFARANKVCKHQIFIREELAWEEARIAQYEATAR